MRKLDAHPRAAQGGRPCLELPRPRSRPPGKLAPADPRLIRRALAVVRVHVLPFLK